MRPLVSSAVLGEPNLGRTILGVRWLDLQNGAVREPNVVAEVEQFDGGDGLADGALGVVGLHVSILRGVAG